MKKIFVGIVLFTLFIPFAVHAQTATSANVQNQVVSMNAQLLVLIQALLEQVKVLQQKLAEVQKQQMKMTLENDELKAEMEERLAPSPSPSSVFTPILVTPSPTPNNSAPCYGLFCIPVKS